MIELVVTASVGRLRDYDCVECNGVAEKTYWIPSDDRGKYKVEFIEEAVYIATEMSNIEVVDREVSIGIPTEVWNVIRGI
jgi:hypothetical protein